MIAIKPIYFDWVHIFKVNVDHNLYQGEVMKGNNGRGEKRRQGRARQSNTGQGNLIPNLALVAEWNVDHDAGLIIPRRISNKLVALGLTKIQLDIKASQLSN